MAFTPSLTGVIQDGLQIARRATGGRTAWLDANSRDDPQINLNWDCIISMAGMTFDISPFIEEVQLPGLAFSNPEVFFQAKMIPVIGTENAGDMTLRLYEDVNLTALKFIMGWHRRGRGANGDYGVRRDYVADVIVYPKDPEGTRLSQIVCNGVLPNSYTGYTFGSGQAERLIMQATLSVTRFDVKAVDGNGPTQFQKFQDMLSFGNRTVNSISSGLPF